MSTTNVPFTLKVQRNEVPVRVVVRDANGRPVRNLTKDDFRVLDDGKPQVITQFSAEGACGGNSRSRRGEARRRGQAAGKPYDSGSFCGALFRRPGDENRGHFPRIRDAATKYLQTALQPSDRVALYTSSGQGNLDFTADRDELQEGLLRLHPVGLFGRTGHGLSRPVGLRSLLD